MMAMCFSLRLGLPLGSSSQKRPSALKSCPLNVVIRLPQGPSNCNASFNVAHHSSISRPARHGVTFASTERDNVALEEMTCAHRARLIPSGPA